jgi:hypothetical protein
MALNLSTVFGISGVYIQSDNYAGSLGTFCDYLEFWNPANATKVDPNTTGTQWLESTADLDFTPGGIAASFGAEQVFYALLSTTLYLYQDNFGNDTLTSPKVNFSPQSRYPLKSWTWQYCSEFGYLPVANISDPTNMISRLRNVTSMLQNHCKDVFPFAPDLPDVDAILRYGGHNMAPSNTMSTDGERDPWRTLGLQTDKEINPSATIRESTTDTPKCNVPPEGERVLGKFYPGQVHGMDMSKSSAEAESEEFTPPDIGFEMFSEALERWLECFGDVPGA